MQKSHHLKDFKKLIYLQVIMVKEENLITHWGTKIVGSFDKISQLSPKRKSDQAFRLFIF